MSTGSTENSIDDHSSALNNRFFKIAYKLAKQHIKSYDEKMSAYHACLVVKGGKVISCGVNSIKRNSFVDQFYKDDFIGLHAECSSICKKKNKINFRGAKVFVLRIRPNNEVAMSKPCNNCQKVLKAYGIKKAYYTTNDGNFNSIKIC